MVKPPAIDRFPNILSDSAPVAVSVPTCRVAPAPAATPVLFGLAVALSSDLSVVSVPAPPKVAPGEMVMAPPRRAS
jgi:hypothetical protein